jgi:hypothetical protein
LQDDIESVSIFWLEGRVESSFYVPHPIVICVVTPSALFVETQLPMPFRRGRSLVDRSTTLRTVDGKVAGAGREFEVASRPKEEFEDVLHAYGWNLRRAQF